MGTIGARLLTRNASTRTAGEGILRATGTTDLSGMHEVSLMTRLLEIARSEAAGAGAARIHLICVRAGTLSGVVPEALRFAFEVLRGNDAVTAGARIEIESVAAQCRCRQCGREFQPPDSVFVCPDCNGLDAEILRGRELELSRMEVV